MGDAPGRARSSKTTSESCQTLRNRRPDDVRDRLATADGDDLRALASVLYIITDLERMADHAEGIAKINLMLDDEPLPRRLGYIPSMSDRAVAMLRNSLKAYIDHDVDMARQICDADDEVDRLQDSVYEESIAAMIADPKTIQRNTYLIWTAHNLERIADRCTNVCERVIYTPLATWRDKRLEVLRRGRFVTPRTRRTPRRAKYLVGHRHWERSTYSKYCSRTVVNAENPRARRGMELDPIRQPPRWP